MSPTNPFMVVLLLRGPSLDAPGRVRSHEKWPPAMPCGGGGETFSILGHQGSDWRFEMERTKVRVDVISDCVCPWCYVGKRRLDEAIEKVADRMEVQVVWHPFQLDPRIPPEGREWE